MVQKDGRKKIVYTVLDKVGLGPIEVMKIAGESINRNPGLIEDVKGGRDVVVYDEYNNRCAEMESFGMPVLVCGWVTWNRNLTVEVLEPRLGKEEKGKAGAEGAERG